MQSATLDAFKKKKKEVKLHPVYCCYPNRLVLEVGVVKLWRMQNAAFRAFERVGVWRLYFSARIYRCIKV